jgi:hypothetical protein
VASEIDAAGNTGSASLTFTLDTTAPNAPTILTSVQNPDGSVTLHGTSEALNTLSIYDGVNLLSLGSITAAADGTWSATTGTLSGGIHGLTVMATDAAGNTSLVSSVITVSVSTAAPLAPMIASVSPDSGAAVDGITNANVLTLIGTAAANSTVNVFDGTTQIGTTTADATGSGALRPRPWLTVRTALQRPIRSVAAPVQHPQACPLPSIRPLPH